MIISNGLYSLIIERMKFFLVGSKPNLSKEFKMNLNPLDGLGPGARVINALRT